MAEPTVIERMVRAWREESGRSFLRTGDMTSDEVAQMLMLAAVRELKKAVPSARLSQTFRPIEFHDGYSAWVGDVIERHLEEIISECEDSHVSKSDKPLSPTNPPSE